jgi:hypothetical protein
MKLGSPEDAQNNLRLDRGRKSSRVITSTSSRVIIIIIKIYFYPVFTLSTTGDDSEPTGGTFMKNTPKI